MRKNETHPDLKDLDRELVLMDWQRLDDLVTVGDLLDRGYELHEIFGKDRK